MDLEKCLEILYQATRQAPMPADAHIACFQCKEALAELIQQHRVMMESKKEPEAPEGAGLN